MHRRGTTACAALAVLVAACAHADILHVPGDYPTIQEAIDAVIEGDEVVVAPGTYYETIELPAVPCTIRSSDGADVTIIDAQQAGSVVVALAPTGRGTVLRGFTITGGLGTGNGGGLCILYANPTVEDCVFAWNDASEGGAVWIVSTGDVDLVDCRFEYNWAEDYAGALWMHDDGFTLTLVRCTFTENSTGGWGGAIQTFANTVLMDCRFVDNGAYGGAGAVYASHTSPDSSLTCSRSSFIGNFSTGAGAISLQHGVEPSKIVECVFIGNFGTYGGAIRTTWVPLQIANCTFAHNEASLGSSVYGTGNEGIAIMNSIFWPADGHAIVSAPKADVRFSNIQGGYEGPGNISADPMFVDPLGPDGWAGTEDDDLRLLPGSPCIDAGCNYGVPFDEFDLDGDGDTAEFLPLDFDGNARFLDDPATPDTGCGATAVVDMGAFEFGDGDVVMPCVGDLDGDRIVGQSDLGLLLSAYGLTAVGDLTCDGVTDQADLGILLAEYGQTCE